MPKIEGFVYFDAGRTGTGNAPFPNVVVSMQGVTIATDANGAFVFDNVADGTYTIVVSKPPPSATHFDFLSQSSVAVTIAGADITGLVFRLGPVRYRPINIIPPSVVLDSVNLITDADGGTFGSFEQASIINRGATPNPPYPGLVPDFTYVMPDPANYVPGGGQYGIQNVMTNNRSNNLGSWWRVADHTKGDETGRFMIVNGDNPGTSFFKTTVVVKPDTYYAFLAWFLNIYRSTDYAPPQFAVRITCPAGQLYYQSVGKQLHVTLDMPEWKQMGTIIYTKEYTTLTIEFISEAPEAWGNDYCVDDVLLSEIIMPDMDAISITKEADKDCALYDQEVTFKIAIKNSSDKKFLGLHFKDELAPCLSFVPGSVFVDDVHQPSYDPNTGWAFDLDENTETTIVFKAKVTCRPASGNICNVAQLIYNYKLIEGIEPIEYRVKSKPVCTFIPQVYKNDQGTWITPVYKGGQQ